MIADKMKNMVANSSAIRAMFEEGNRLAGIYGAENVFDFSLGNPNVPAPEASRRPSGLRKTTIIANSLAHRTTWLRSDFDYQPQTAQCPAAWAHVKSGGQAVLGRQPS